VFTGKRIWEKIDFFHPWYADSLGRNKGLVRVDRVDVPLEAVPSPFSLRLSFSLSLVFYRVPLVQRKKLRCFIIEIDPFRNFLLPIGARVWEFLFETVLFFCMREGGIVSLFPLLSGRFER